MHVCLLFLKLCKCTSSTKAWKQRHVRLVAVNGSTAFNLFVCCHGDGYHAEDGETLYLMTKDKPTMNVQVQYMF